MLKKLLCKIAGIFWKCEKEAEKDKKAPAEPGPLYPGIGGLDPYVDWTLGTGERYFFVRDDQQEWIPILVRLEGVSAKEFADGDGLIDRSDLRSWRKSLRVPSAYTNPATNFKRKHCTALVRREFFDLLQANERMEDVVTSITLSLPLRAASLCNEPLEVENPLAPAGDTEAGTVVVGVIDDGIAFANERFRDAVDSTRVEYMWIQDGIHEGFPEDYCYGSELRKDVTAGGPPSIDQMLNENIRAGLVDEDEVYRRSGLIDFQRPGHKSAAWRTAHGTHVMDLACGFAQDNAPNNRPIVCVQLPAETTADTSGAELDGYAIDAIEYILSRADRIASDRGSGPLPVVINFSYGTIAGPHDGGSSIEVAMDEIIEERHSSTGQHLQIVIPSGNSHLSRCHAELPFDHDGQVRSLHWRVLPDDRTPSFLEIWMPRRNGEGAQSRLKVTVKTPGNIQLNAVHEVHDSRAQWPPEPEPDPRCRVTHKHVTPHPDRGLFLVSLHPTASLDVSDPLAPAGIWTIELESENFAGDFTAKAWIQRDETLYGHPRRGRQSYFDNTCYERFDYAGRELEYDPPGSNCEVRRTRLINALATGQKTVAIGGLIRNKNVPSKYSAGGPLTQPPGSPSAHWPNAATVSDDTRVHKGVLATGSRSGSEVAMYGTSVAAPVITRLIADELAAGNPGGPAEIENMASTVDPGPHPGPFRARIGAGRMILGRHNRLRRHW